jgi:hypothetical protein
MEQSQILDRAKVYISAFNGIKEEVGDERVATAILQEVAKDRRMDEIRSEQEARNGEPATAKQVALMKKLNVSFRKGVTKREASELLDEALGKD